MYTKRIIPCLDVNNGRVVKGTNFVNLKDAGDPIEVSKLYDSEGADELVFLDITASSDARERCSRSLTTPMTGAATPSEPATRFSILPPAGKQESPAHIRCLM